MYNARVLDFKISVRLRIKTCDQKFKLNVSEERSDEIFLLTFKRKSKCKENGVSNSIKWNLTVLKFQNISYVS